MQAALAEEPPVAAYVALDRLNNDAAFRAEYSMADAALMLEGRLLEYHAPTRFPEDRPSGDAPNLRLVELFTCVDQPETAAAELAFRGLAEYFGEAGVSFVQYHLAQPTTDPLVTDAAETRARFYEIARGPAARFDGGTAVDAGGSDKEIDAVYRKYKAAALAGSPAESAWQLTGHAAVSGDAITGGIDLVGPQGGPDLRLHVVLCERVVMAPSANGVLMHYQVARTAVTPAEGLAVRPTSGTRHVPVEVRLPALSESLEATLKRDEEAKGVEYRVRPTYVDAAACNLVAFLQHDTTRKVFAAVTINVSSAVPEP